MSGNNLKRKFSEMDSSLALLLAILYKSRNTRLVAAEIPIVQRSLNELRSSLLSGHPIDSPQTLPVPVLSLLPLILSSKSSEIVCCGAEFVGAASLFSMEMNEQIAGDGEAVKALVALLASSKRRVRIAACNTVLDVCTTSLGRRRLLELCALDTLMLHFHTLVQLGNLASISFGFLQAPKSSTSVFLCAGDGASITSLKIGFKEDPLLALLLDAAVILLNTCSIAELEEIQLKRSEQFSLLFKEMWGKLHDQMVLGSILTVQESRQFYLSNVTMNNMAESLFRLSISDSQITLVLPSEVVGSTIFGSSGTTFKDFLLNYWELSPFLLGKFSSAMKDEIYILRIIERSLDSKSSPSFFISSILKNLISCPPIASDELDILSFLKQVRDKLGCSLIYEQDIRVLRAEMQTRGEVHFFPKNLDKSVKMPHFLFINDILKCEEAFREGFTIALRGMEFRHESIASIAGELASMFGQPSIGANLYLTPPNSQGLAMHYDDHCVFVCQLLGTKKWKISTEPIVKLPRLYAPRTSVYSGNDEVSVGEFRTLMLREGDILYIPRGYAHEACTGNIGSDVSVGFSLHLTLAFEIEPPFEWEGFVHVALFCWSQTQKHHYNASGRLVNIMSINLLHLSIRSISDSDPSFRKACLVASDYPSSYAHGWLYTNQENTFRNLIDTISATSSLSETLGTLELAIQKQDDPLKQIGWLEFLKSDGELDEREYWDMPFMGIDNLFRIYSQYRDMAEDAFMQVKNRFCREVAYEDSIESYKRLLERYKKVRTQYRNGMLSLHSSGLST